jgi:hypothetical protein
MSLSQLHLTIDELSIDVRAGTPQELCRILTAIAYLTSPFSLYTASLSGGPMCSFTPGSSLDKNDVARKLLDDILSIYFPYLESPNPRPGCERYYGVSFSFNEDRVAHTFPSARERLGIKDWLTSLLMRRDISPKLLKDFFASVSR